MKKDKNLVPVYLPKEYIENVEKRAKKIGFDSASSYIVYILRQVEQKLEQKVRKNKITDSSKERIIKKRLKVLGYL